MTTLSSLVAPYNYVPIDRPMNTLLFMENPTGLTDASWSTADAVRILKPGVTAQPFDVSLSSDGYSTDIAAYNGYVRCYDMPNFSAPERRVFEIWGRTKDATLTHDRGVRVQFNIETKWTDYWIVQLRNISGSYYNLKLIEITASSQYTRGEVNFSTAVNEPAYFHLWVWDSFDSVVAQASMWEQDAASTSHEAKSIAYYTAGRPHSGYRTEAYLSWHGSAASAEWFIAGGRIGDYS